MNDSNATIDPRDNSEADSGDPSVVGPNGNNEGANEPGDEVEVVATEDGFALFGDTETIDRFLDAEHLPAKSFTLPKLGAATGLTSAALQAGASISAESGRWIQLTEQSARMFKHAKAMVGPEAGVARAILMQDGKTAHILQFVTKPGALLTNPAVLANVGGIMAQLAIQQQMDEISDHLERLDAKIDEVLQAQTDAALAEMIGIGLVLDDALVKRTYTNGIGEVAWSQVQGSSVVIARTQAYGLKRLDALTSKLESTKKLSDIAKISAETETTVAEWLAVLARCFQLQDALAVLEIDRVLETDQDAIDQHRRAINAARTRRRELISRSTSQLLQRMIVIAGDADTKVLFRPFASSSVVESSNRMALAIVEFHRYLGIESAHEVLASTPWLRAVGKLGAPAVAAGAAGVEAAAKLGIEARDRTETLVAGLAVKTLERQGFDVVKRSEDGTAAGPAAQVGDI